MTSLPNCLSLAFAAVRAKLSPQSQGVGERVHFKNPQYAYKLSPEKTKTSMVLLQNRIDTFYTSLDKVLAEIENRFSGNDFLGASCSTHDISELHI